MNRIDGESETFITHALRADGFDASEDGTGRGTPLVPVEVVAGALGAGDGARGWRNDLDQGAFIPVAFAQNTRDEVRLQGGDGQISGALGSDEGMKQRTYLATQLAVRRLTPTECEALQGFPRNYTAVPHRGKPAADGPRYKSLGNSMAVPVLRWILSRIEATA
jgi:DNA (cytosine-5)-methyltransferase 1